MGARSTGSRDSVMTVSPEAKPSPVMMKAVVSESAEAKVNDGSPVTMRSDAGEASGDSGKRGGGLQSAKAGTEGKKECDAGNDEGASSASNAMTVEERVRPEQKHVNQLRSVAKFDVRNLA